MDDLTAPAMQKVMTDRPSTAAASAISRHNLLVALSITNLTSAVFDCTTSKLYDHLRPSSITLTCFTVS